MCPIIRIFGYPIGTYGLCMILGFACIGVGTVISMLLVGRVVAITNRFVTQKLCAAVGL